MSIGCQSVDDRLEETMHKSVSWLWQQQSPDGGWHSQTHTILKDGKALTPYILFYLLQVPEDVYARPDSSVEKGLAFIRHNIRSSMTMSKDSLPQLNYPNYSAAYALRVLCLTHQDTALQRIIADHLLNEQFVEQRGITPDNLAYGGWGYGEPGLAYGAHGNVDISHTRRVIESLIMYDSSLLINSSMETEGQMLRPAFAHPCATAQQPGGRAEGQKSFHRAELVEVGVGGLNTYAPLNTHLLGRQSPFEESISVKNREGDSRSHALTLSRLFLQGVQRTPKDPRLYEGCLSRKALPYDGGFISSTVTLSINKCEPIFIEGAGYHYPSYATATCDGLLALHALGMTDTQAFSDAKQWLTSHQDMSTIDGLSKDDPEQWHEVMHYYHWAVRAEAMTAAGIEGRWSKKLKRLLIDEQQWGGYYVNPLGGVNKENDPLMATIFAVQAGNKVKNEK